MSKSNLDSVDLPKPNSSDLYDRLGLLGKLLSPDQKKHLLLAALYNDLRLFENDPEKRLTYIREFCLPGGPLKQAFNSKRLDVSIERSNWLEQVIHANRALSWVPGTKPLERSFALNKWLVDSGFCPLVHFAFDQWYEIGQSGTEGDRVALEHVADLSTTFLYRLIPTPEAFTNGALLGGGAYTNVYRSDDGRIAHKVPKNMASYHFASEEEYRASRFAETTDLAPYLPKTLCFDPQTKIIQREFVAGTAGFELLQDGGFRSNPHAMEDIRAIYHAACDIYESTGINFDIHPGNIMWATERNNWVLVDLGPMPYIGAEYFPRDSFDDYFQKIWLDLNALMVNVPIRSLDIIFEDKASLSAIGNALEFNP